MSLADSILDKDAEITTLKSKLKSVDIEQEHRGKLETLHSQIESEIKLKESLEKENKLQVTQFQIEKSSWLAESEQFKQQIELLKEELSSTHQSFNEYKLRAQRILQVLNPQILRNMHYSFTFILQDKDRLLQDIKQQNKEDGIQPSELLVAELQQLQQERDLLREEIAQSNAQLQQSRKELSASQKRYHISFLLFSWKSGCENAIGSHVGLTRKSALYAALTIR